MAPASSDLTENLIILILLLRLLEELILPCSVVIMVDPLDYFAQRPHPKQVQLLGLQRDSFLVVFPPNCGVSPQTSEWNGYLSGVFCLSPERSVLPPSTYPMNNSVADTSSFSQYQQQIPVEEFPERPDQPECTYYLKTGDCKFKYKCKYHHPENRLPKQAPYSFNDKDLPLRPDQNMCTHYICKFGPACRFDHSIPPTFSPSSSQTIEYFLSLPT